MEAIDSCGMASLDTSSMDVGMTVLSHYESMGAIRQSSNPISPKTTCNLSPSLPDNVLYLFWLTTVLWYTFLITRTEDEMKNVGPLSY